MANQTLLTDNFSDNASFAIAINATLDHLGTSDHDPSVFNLIIDSNYYLNQFGIYDGFCLQPWLPIGDTTYSAELYYSTENFEINTFVDLNQDFTLNEPFTITDEDLQLPIFLLNHLTWEDLDGDGDLEGIISDGQGGVVASGLEIADIEYLIWTQIYGLYAPDYAGGGLFDESPYGDRSLDGTTNATLLETLNTLGANYVPEKAGDKIGVILVPNDGSQFVLSTIELSGLGDHVWLDINEDGIRDDNETGVEGVTVELLADLNQNGQIEIEEVLETTITDADGFYAFDGIITDNYQVRFIQPAQVDGKTVSGFTNENESIDSNGLSSIINLAPGEFENISVGLAMVFSIGNTIFLDSNSNGLSDAEEGIRGVTVRLDIDGDGIFDLFQITDDQGIYQFDNLPAQDYTVAVDTDTLPEALINTVDPDGGNDSMSHLSLTTGENNLYQNFGYDYEVLSAGAESGVNICPKTTILTDNVADQVVFRVGIYGSNSDLAIADSDPSFFNLAIDSDYYLKEFGIYDGFCIQPWLPIKNRSYSASLYYSTEEFEINTLVDLNEDLLVDEEFTLTDEALQASVFTLNNLTWEDLDGDGDLEGIISDGQEGTLASGLEMADIQYLLWKQIYGLYAPDYPEFDETRYGDRTLDNTTNTALLESIDAIATNYVPEKTGDKVGVILIPDNGSQFVLSTVELSGLGNYVWLDTDEDGIQDDNETGVEGVTVELLTDLDQDGQIETDEVSCTAVTGGDGFYSFDGIMPGDYQVRFVEPEEVNGNAVTGFTTQNAGVDSSIDSDADSNGLSSVISLIPAEFNDTIDAGLQVEISPETAMAEEESQTVTDTTEVDPLTAPIQTQQLNVIEFIEQAQEVLSATENQDQFIFSQFSEQHSHDVIENFESGVDSIDLSEVLDYLGSNQSDVTLVQQNTHTMIKINDDALVQVNNITETELANSILF